jgi:hypothetical protein
LAVRRNVVVLFCTLAALFVGALPVAGDSPFEDVGFEIAISEALA